MGISVMVKPRRTDFKYMAFLLFQWAILTLCNEVSEAPQLFNSSSSF